MTKEIKIDITQDQLQALVQHAEEESDYWLTIGSMKESSQWQKVRDQLASYLTSFSEG